MNDRHLRTGQMFLVILLLLQILLRTWLIPFHLLAVLLSVLLIRRYHHWRWVRMEPFFGLIGLYLWRLLLLFTFLNWGLWWFLYYLFMSLLILWFLLQVIQSFFC